MVTLKTLDSSILSFAILIIVLLNAYNRSDKIFTQYKLFISLIILNMVLILVDVLGWVFNGLPGLLNYVCNYGFNLLLYILAPMAPSVWVLYTYYMAFHEEDKIKNVRRTLIILFMANALISITSLYTGLFFRVDSSNIYHRGSAFLFHAAYCYGLLIYSFYFVWKMRKSFSKKHYYSMLLFFLPQTIGTTIQMFYYGVSYNWSGMMISLLIVYFNIQDRGLNTDFLTGVNNRRYLDDYIKARIRNCTGEKSFAAIMIDIDDFKSINDRFGHETGDDALKDAVQIIQKSLDRDDFISRFGGDEFFIIISINTRQMLEDTVQRINQNVEQYNMLSAKPYRLNFSIGADVYECRLKWKTDDFIKHIDTLMYDHKKQKS